MPLTWSIDGRKVRLNDDWEATSTSSGGWEQLTATADREDVRHAHQGSRISAHDEARVERWSGTIDATPVVSRLPTAKITATGPVSRLRRARGNWLAQARDYGAWTPADSDPYGYTSTDRVQVDSQGGRLKFTIPNGTDSKLNQQGGLVAWFPGESVTRVAFDWGANVASTDVVLRIMTATGPAGALTQRGADITVNATSGSVDRAITADDDLVSIRMVWTSADATTTSTYNLRVVNLRVNGRSTGDDVSPGEIIADMAETVGISAGKNRRNVKSSGQNALPFYWEGGSWADAVADLAALDDWPWLVTRDGIAYDRWTPTWHLDFSEENEDLDFPPIYNRVRVSYQTDAGATRSIRVEASPDPLARFGIDSEYEFDLGQSYASDDIPTAVANAILERVSHQQVMGSVTVTHGRPIGRTWTPRRRFTTFADDQYRITPGTTANLDPYPKLGPQRIVGVRYRSDGVTVEFGEDAEAAAGRVLARVALARARARQKVHRRKKS